jgi:ribosomal protein S18 acetylase RimI-like enzyme
MDVNLRRCIPGDETMLTLLGGATFLETYAGYVAAEDIMLAARNWHAPDFYAAWLARSEVDVHVAEAEAGRAMVGYVALVPHEDGAAPGLRLEVKRIYLLHRFQGTGLGKRLMTAALTAAHARGAAEVWLDVAEFNAHAITFYTAFGYRILSTKHIVTPDHSYPVHTLVKAL